MDLTASHYELFDLPACFEVDLVDLGERFRRLQKALHPDKFASADAASMRLAMQYSSKVNEAYSVLKTPLTRALYLLEMAGFDAEKIADHKPGGMFMMQQMELREALEEASTEAELDTLLIETQQQIEREEQALAAAFNNKDYTCAAELVNQCQYSVKFISEIEQSLVRLRDN